MGQSLKGLDRMRSTTKAIIGFGSILGLYALGALVYGSFTLGDNDTGPEIVAMLLYGLTFLPACLLAIWFRKLAAWWLLLLFPLTALGFIYQTVVQGTSDATVWSKAGSIAGDLATAAVPGLFGFLLLRSKPDIPLTRNE